MFQVPSVTMNGGKRNRATKNPLTAPAAVPAAKPTMTASGPGNPASTAVLPITTDDKTIIAPTDKSMPAVKITSVCAMPKMPMSVTCCKIRDKLKG